MIEREFVSRKKKEFQIQEFIKENLSGVGLSHSKILRTPLGEKIIIHAARPGLIIGSGGSNIKKLTQDLKNRFGLENPQIEIDEIKDTNIVAAVVAERIANSLERYGTMRFKGIGHRVMSDALNAGAKGIEILISGKIPSSRARTWRFYYGYVKKCGNAAMTLVDIAYETAHLKSGAVGIKVSIMPPNVRLPDDVKFREEDIQVEELSEEESKKAEKEIKENSEKTEKKEESKIEEEKKEKKTQKKTEKKETKPKKEKKLAKKKDEK